MENFFLISVGSALWLGILTSISPCPLAANIAAVSYLGKIINSKIGSIFSGICYALGRVIVYTGIATIIIASIVSIPELSMFLQTKINLFIGPILVLAGLILIGVIKLNIPGNSHSGYAKKLIKKGPYLGSLLIGSLFALAFCPVSAAFFFGSMLPLSIKHESFFIIPAVYGIGTALPVIGFSILIAGGSRYVGIVFDKLNIVEAWVRKITGLVFILIGIYFIMVYIFKIPLF